MVGEERKFLEEGKNLFFKHFLIQKKYKIPQNNNNNNIEAQFGQHVLASERRAVRS